VTSSGLGIPQRVDTGINPLTDAAESELVIWSGAIIVWTVCAAIASGGFSRGSNDV
jgi:hypothetical protein